MGLIYIYLGKSASMMAALGTVVGMCCSYDTDGKNINLKENVFVYYMDIR